MYFIVSYTAPPRLVMLYAGCINLQNLLNLNLNKMMMMMVMMMLLCLLSFRSFTQRAQF